MTDNDKEERMHLVKPGQRMNMCPYQLLMCDGSYVCRFVKPKRGRSEPTCSRENCPFPLAPQHTDEAYKVLEGWVLEVARQNQILYEQRLDRDDRIKELEAELDWINEQIGPLDIKFGLNVVRKEELRK